MIEDPDPEIEALYTWQLALIYEKMDAGYDRIARLSGFECRGCSDNCCYARFYHHTLLDYLYLRKGCFTLHRSLRTLVLEQAKATVETDAAADKAQERVPVICPLNREEKCLLYPYRPMICRLHGIPHRMNRPDGQILTGPGCEEFEKQNAPGDLFLDRTPCYRELATLERELRTHTGIGSIPKRTIALMVTSFFTRVSG